jgi:hypothetical protein
MGAYGVKTAGDERAVKDTVRTFVRCRVRGLINAGMSNLIFAA